MRKLAWLLLAVMAFGAFSCKTNEKNMNDAYVKAIQGRNADSFGLDSTIYTKIRREMQHGEMTVGDRKVDVSSQWVNVTKDGGGLRESLKRYNVVVGQFKLLFNAKSMRERIADGPYPGAFVVETGEPYYYVIAGSFDEVTPAIDMLERAKADTVLKLKSPLPFILEPAQWRR